MPTIVRFEDIQAWQNARVLTRDIYKFTSSGDFAKDFGLRDQIRRAAVSIMSNIAEGFDRNQGPTEYRRFLAIAKGSAAEVKAQMYVASDLSYVSEEEFSSVQQQLDTVSRQIGGLMTYLKEIPAAKPITRNSQPANSKPERNQCP
ncbi:MAG: four helix bundle protein [Armatimonadetes bacterium]|nr:four helix bundle protein [Armatimonadota bacterium]